MKRNRWKWLAVPFFALLAAGGASSARAEGPLDGLTYTLHTEYKTAGGDIVSVASPGVQAVPVLVDADKDATTGVGGADIMGQLTIDAGRATLRVTKLPNTPATFPLKVEAILSDPRRGLPLPLLGEPDDGLRIAFGYDALSSTTPSAYDATIAIAGADRVSSFSLDLHTAAAGPTIGVIAEVFEQGTGGERIDPIRGRVDFTPVPAVAHFGVLSGEDIGLGLGAGQASIDLASDIPTVVDVLIEDIRGDHVSRITAKVDELPRSLSIIQTDVEGTGQQTFTYRASDRIDLLTLRATVEDGGLFKQDSLLELEDMATNAVLVQDSANHATFQADSPIGRVTIGLASGGPAVYLSDPAYLHIFDDGIVDSLSFQLLGLQSADVTGGDPFRIAATMKAGPFRALIVDGTTTIDAHFIDLPSSVSIAGSPEQGTLSYQGSAGMERITVHATDPSGIGGSRATSAELLLRSVPTELNLDYGADSGTISLDAGSAFIGLLELLLTSGPPATISPELDGIVYEDLADRFVVFARVTALRRVAAIQEDSVVGLDLDSAAGRVFTLEMDTLNDQGNPATIDARVDHLVPEMSLRFDTAAGTMTYTGGGVIDEITLQAFDPDGLVDRATTLDAVIRQIPQTLDLAFGQDGGKIGVDAKGATLGLIEVLLTSGPDERLAAQYDGIYLRDTADRYVLSARVNGLKEVSVTQSGTGAIELVLDTTTRRVFVADLEEPNEHGQQTYIRGTIDTLVPGIRLGYDPEAGAITYSGGDTVSLFTLDAYDPAGLVDRATRAQLRLEQIPTGLDLTFGDGGSNATLDAKGSTLGLFQAKLSSNPNAADPIAGDGVVLRDTDTELLVFGRVTGLRKVVVEQGPPPSVILQTTGGRPFTIDVAQQKTGGVATTVATIQNLPSSLSLQFTSGTSVAYAASAPVALLTIDAFDPAGISGRAKTLDATLTGLPAAFDVSFDSTGAVTLDAKGSTIGQIELQLTSGPDERITPATDDGILFKDITDRYVAFVRFTSLRKVTATTRPLPNLFLDSTGGRVFRFDINSMDGLKQVYVRGVLDNLVPNMNISVTEGASGQTIVYTASVPTDSLSLDTNSGSRVNLHLDIAPLPTSLTVCQSPGGTCSNHTNPNAGSIKIDASQHVTINMFDNVSASEFTRVQNLYIRYLTLDVWIGGSIADGEDGHLWFDTNNHEMRGFIETQSGSGGFRMNLKPGFNTNDRHSHWTNFGLPLIGSLNKQGHINCAGSSLDARVLGFWIGITSYLC